LGLAAQFDAVVFSDAWGRDAWKPNALPFNVVFERLETTGSRAMYVGDNPDKDFIGARRVGMWTVRVRHPLGLHARVEPVSSDHAPDVEIEDITALKQIVRHADGTRDFQKRTLATNDANSHE
jgi:putative hydrolase of the HAD superfamily